MVDAFDGSGTTTATAKAEGRAFLGCDLFYSDLREERLEATGMVTASELPGVSSESLAVWQAVALVEATIPRFE